VSEIGPNYQNKGKNMIKKILTIMAIALLLPASVFANGETEAAEGMMYADGIYFAQEDGFAGSGWKSVVTIEVKDGKIVSAAWNGANKAAGPDKVTVSKSGNYPMVANGGAQSDWHVQAETTQDYFLANPGMVPAYKDDEGHTDAISGVSIHVLEFYDMAEKAMAAGPVGYGMYKDGAAHAEETEYAESGWRSTADFTVISGYIVAASWNGIHKDGGDDKRTLSEAGGYPMVANGGAQSEWHVQAMETETYFIATQGKVPSYKDDAGHTDAISGVSVHVLDFYNLADEALSKR
jgi:major membrane immunogen (membrane-anchored lipoprotein)